MPSDIQPHPDQRGGEPHPDRPRNVSNEVDYAPKAEASKELSESRQKFVRHIINLYCGKASEEDMWNEKDFSHKGLRALIQKLNSDKLTNITKPPESV